MTTLTLYGKDQAHAALSALWAAIKPQLVDGKRLTLKVEEERRSNEQNKRLWAMLGDISRQVEWHGTRLSPEDWKGIFTAAMKQARIVPGLDGGFVVLAQSSSKMTKAEMSEMQEMMAAFGAERDVVFHDQA